MAVRVHVQNFQSIQDATVEIVHLTVVTGTNNSGKTALQRACKGVFQNTPGTAFIRHGETKCAVTMDFGPDGKIRWSKGTGKRDRPTYVINDGEPLNPGSSVPDEVRAFGVAPIVCGGQEEWPNIAEQFTGQVFLLSRPGSALAEAVADVERVSLLNKALRKEEGNRRRVVSRISVREEDLAQQEAEVQSFEGLDGVLEGLDVLDEKRAGLERVDRALDALTDLNQQWGQAQASLSLLAPVSDIEVPDDKGMAKCLSDMSSLRTLHERWTRSQEEVAQYEALGGLDAPEGERPLQALLDEHSSLSLLQSRWEQAEASVSAYEAARGLDAEVDAGKCQKMVRAIDMLKAMQERLRAEEQAVDRLQGLVAKADASLDEAEAEVKATLEALGACPTCGTALGSMA